MDSRTVDARSTQHNFTTVAIVPVSDEVPLTAFTFELYHSLCAIGNFYLQQCYVSLISNISLVSIGIVLNTEKGMEKTCL